MILFTDTILINYKVSSKIPVKLKIAEEHLYLLWIMFALQYVISVGIPAGSFGKEIIFYYYYSLRLFFTSLQL